MSLTLELSKLGFGCAPVMGKIGRRQSLNAMSVAFEQGITHFDVARSYGFGNAEAIVGQFIKQKRDKVSITTKFGVIPPNLSLVKQLAIPTVRVASKIFPILNRALKKKSGVLLANQRFDVSYAEQCLDTSLKQLNTDYIDFYLLHDPDINTLMHHDELKSFLERAQRSGKILQWGASYERPADFNEYAANLGSVAQYECNMSNYKQFNPIQDQALTRMITRPFSGGQSYPEALHQLLSHESVQSKLSAIEADINDLALCFAFKMAGNHGSVICSMFSERHILKNAKAMTTLYQTPEMQYILNLL